MSDDAASRAGRGRPGWTRVRLIASARGVLADDAVHDIVVSSAEAIAERTGVTLVSIEVDEAGVTAVVEGDRLAALGLAAELRRLTGAWYSKRFPGTHLWVEPPRDDGNGEGDDWGNGGGGDEDGPDGGDPDDDRPPYGMPEFRDPYAFNDEDLLLSDPDVIHDMEIIEENLRDDLPPSEDEFDPDDPYWRRRDDPLGP
mgnify:CR=1 FL=1